MDLSKVTHTYPDFLLWQRGMLLWMGGRDGDEIYLTFCKAFTIGSHNILLSSLRKYGLDDTTINYG